MEHKEQVADFVAESVAVVAEFLGPGFLYHYSGPGKLYLLLLTALT